MMRSGLLVVRNRFPPGRSYQSNMAASLLTGYTKLTLAVSGTIGVRNGTRRLVGVNPLNFLGEGWE